MLEYHFQNIADTSLLYFFDSTIMGFDPTQFLVLKSLDFLYKNFFIEVSIIGQSHFFTLKNQSREIIFAEVLACIDPKNFSPSVVFDFYSQKNIEQKFFLSKQKLHISVEACIGEKNFERGKWQYFTSQTSARRIEYVFPGSVAPRTSIQVWEEKMIFHIETLHEYTNADGSLTPLFTSTKIFQ